MANHLSNKSLMKPEDFKQTERNFQRYKENLASLSQEFELGLFLYLTK
jgi:hypothetical protein